VLHRDGKHDANCDKNCSGAARCAGLTITLYAKWGILPKDSLYEFLTDPVTQGLFQSDAVNFVIDLVNGDKVDRQDPNNSRFLQAFDYMTNTHSIGDIRFITDTKNAILTDGQSSGAVENPLNPGAWIAPENGKTFYEVEEFERWLQIALFIVSGIPNCVSGINYKSDSVLVFGFMDNEEGNLAREKYRQDLIDSEKPGGSFPTNDPSPYYIDLTSDKISFPLVETILEAEDKTRTTFAPYTPMAFSTDGGKKWRVIKAKSMFDDVRFPRLLNKDLELWVSDAWITRAVKNTDKEAVKGGAPKLLQPKGVPDGKGSEPAANIIKFQKIDKRPKIGGGTVKFAVNYGIYADTTGVTPGGWALGKKEDAKTPLAELVKGRPSDGSKKYALIDGWQVGATETSKDKIPDTRGYGRFCEGIECKKSNTYCFGMGIPVKPFGGDKRTVYFVRTEPGMKITGSGVSYTAASRAKKVNVSSELKETRLKPRQIKEKIKVTDKKSDPPKEEITKRANIVFKLKLNDNIFAGDEAALRAFAANPSDRTETDRDGILLPGGNFFRMTGPKGGIVSVLDGRKLPTDPEATPTTGNVTVWKSASARKPATAKQVIPTG
jgi:hypothetical protein